MIKDKDLGSVKVNACDYCEGDEVATQCYFCGKDICVDCMAWVQFVDKEVVRGKVILFFYSKPMCKAHLPAKREDGCRQS